MAANSSTSRDDSPCSASIRPHLLFYAPPPPPVMGALPFGMYYAINPTYTYYTPQPVPLHTNPRPPLPVDRSATAAATSSDLDIGASRRRVAQTTLMIQNIPHSLRRISVLKFLDRCCEAYPDIEYDLFHLPLDCRRSGSNKGFAFVNFTTNDGAKKMMQILKGHKWQGNYDGQSTSSKNVCNITWVIDNQQGKEAQIRRFEKSRFKSCDDEEFSPVIFEPPRNGSHRVPTPPFPLRRRFISN